MDNELHQRQFFLHYVSRFLSNLILILFGFAGAFTGSITGAIAGSASHSGILRGAGVGAIAGATLSIEVLEAASAYWSLHRSGTRGPSPLADFLESIISRRLVEDEHTPPLRTAHRWQVRVANMTYDYYDIYDDFAISGLSANVLKKLPHQVIMEDINEIPNVYCTICLQDIEVGETARTLPRCGHMYHLMCVDEWLSRHGSCPMCRQDV